MKRILLLMLLCISSTIAMAQTTWTGLGSNTNWNTTDNWDTNLVPTASDDVIIPTGFTVTLNVAGNVRSIDVQGLSVFDMNTNFTFSEPSTFGTNTTINWTSGTINGTMSTLTNLGTLNLTTTANKVLAGATTLENGGTLNITSTGDLFLQSAGTELNNAVGGTIDMQADAGNITSSTGLSVINNSGMLKKTTSTGEAQIFVILNNNDGIIQVEEGTLSFQSAAKNFTDGNYNVFAGATMDWDTTINPSGSLEGSIDGDLNWNSTVNIPVGETAAFNFSADENFNWTSGTLSGGGTLTNTNVLKLVGPANKIVSNTVLENQGTLIFTSDGDLFLQSVGAILNNPVGGIIDMQADAGNITSSTGLSVLNNSGMLKKTTSTGEAQIFVILNNNDGTIQVEEGTLSFQSAAKNFTDGNYNVFAGATMDWDTTINPSGSLEGTIDGDLNWNSTVNIPVGETAAFNFSADENFNWTSGTLSGGGTLTNTNVLKLVGSANKIIQSATTLENQGTLIFTSNGDLFLQSEGTVLNNPEGGIIDMQADGGNINTSTGLSVFNNAGLLKRTTTTGLVQIFVTINNNDGTIQVEEGILSFQSAAKNFTDGNYNVFAGATMNWDTTINPSGSLEGSIDGDLNWNNVVNVVDGTFAAFNFSEDENFNWTTGSLSGGGTLTNTNVLKLVGSANKIIQSATTLENQGTLIFTSNGDLFLQSEGTVLNNPEGGIIDMQADGGNINTSTGLSVLNNAGLLKRTTTTGLVQILVTLNNSGTIEVESGELEITGSAVFTNEETGIVKGIGIFDLPTVANHTNNGTFAPGLSPGTLSVQGDFKSTATSVLDIELNGLTPDTEHDVLAITGTNNVFEGTVNVTMGFEGTVGDTFTIATTSGTIATANLQSPIENVDFDGKRYTFDVSYPDNNKVVLTITDKLDILPPDIITQNITVQLDATGNVSIADTDVDNGTTDNCTPTNELQFSLDITDFTCADLGDNIVTLTVTDNDGNFADAQATVTVEDNIAPTAVTQDITVELDASGNASILASDIDNGSSDNCTITSLDLDVSDFTCVNLGNNTVSLTVIDESGNTDSATAIVTVVDNISPTALVQNVTLQLDATGSAFLFFSAIDNGTNDNCNFLSFNFKSNFTCADIGENSVEFTATDLNGNSDTATAIITVEDVINPTAIAQNITVMLDGSGNVSISPSDIDDGSSDNCTVSSLDLDISDFTCADLGDNTVELIVTDQSGNTDSAFATVTVTDTESPVIICPSGFNVQSNGDFTLPDYFLDNTVTATDNCSITVVQNPVPGTILPDGDYTISFTVTDASGNSDACSFDFKVEDTTLSVDDFELSSDDVLLFPNPVNDIFTIKNNSRLQLKNAEIFDVTGKRIQIIDLRTMTLEKEVSLVNYATGMYVIRISAENNSTLIKRIVKK